MRRARFSPYWYYALVGGAVGLALTAIGVAVLDLPLYPAWIIGLSICTFVLYGFDKRRAISGAGRVPEAVLHGLALAGGFPGGWAGRSAFRHKTRHTSFLVVLVLATVLHVALYLWLR
ncbi:MAG TPA: DUF1294 domain-containing protein [Thermomicrobiales bacterium]|nr:DUF1294 domain-containing protein [Thermomicrobiales bacterium]